MTYEYLSNSVDETIKIGCNIGSQLKGGEVIALTGPLGSGKTYLVKGIAEGAEAGEKSVPVNSPTFVLVNEYSGRLDIFHIDAYRINSIKEFEQIGFDDFCYPNSAVLIEWADKVESALKGINYVRITLSYHEKYSRKIYIENLPAYFDLNK
jgi:tRNA threonylcarbamoyladenosine biosynthesis protein TsaE